MRTLHLCTIVRLLSRRGKVGAWLFQLPRCTFLSRDLNETLPATLPIPLHHSLKMSAFERLPSEVLLEIVGLVDRLHDRTLDGNRQTKDLANLRLTCRLLANAAAVPLFSRVSETNHHVSGGECAVV